MTRRITFVHAHPDDESSKGAATAARYADEGVEVALVTCTGGEAGEVLNPSAEPIELEAMPGVRARELATAVDIIGFTRTYLLGFRDSGYHEDPADIPEGTFARTPVDVVATALAAILRQERPHVVVTYPQDGGYPHPDHIRCHDVTVRGVELAAEPGPDPDDEEATVDGWVVPKVYAATAFPRERVQALHDGLVARGLDSPFEEWLDRRTERHEFSREVAARIHVADWFGRRDDALRAHVTQVDPDGFWFAVPRDLERDAFPYECFQLLSTEVPVDLPEDDLFAGIEGV